MNATTTDRMDLNLAARKLLAKTHPELLFSQEVLILAARPHIIEVQRGPRVHTYDRWTWNIHVHGKMRTTLRDFLLVKMQPDGTIETLFLVPYDIAMKRKSAALYSIRTSRKRHAKVGWLKYYEIGVQRE